MDDDRRLLHVTRRSFVRGGRSPEAVHSHRRFFVSRRDVRLFAQRAISPNAIYRASGATRALSNSTRPRYFLVKLPGRNWPNRLSNNVVAVMEGLLQLLLNIFITLNLKQN